jgi:hypothetical protein
MDPYGHILGSEFLATDLEAQVRFPALPKEKKKKENISGSGTRSTQLREYN